MVNETEESAVDESLFGVQCVVLVKKGVRKEIRKGVRKKFQRHKKYARENTITY